MGKGKSGATPQPPPPTPRQLTLCGLLTSVVVPAHQDFQPIDLSLSIVPNNTTLFLLSLASFSSMPIIIIIPLQNLHMDRELVNIKDLFSFVICDNGTVIMVFKSPHWEFPGGLGVRTRYCYC